MSTENGHILIYFFVCMVLGIFPSAKHMLGNYSTIVPHPQAF